MTSAAPRLLAAVDRGRLLDTAIQLVAAESKTGRAGPACDVLATILGNDGFRVERPAGNHPAAPAVVVRFDSGKPGRCLQFDGHLDTVHLPFVPPAVVGEHLTGSGAVDMKGGVAAMVEAVRALRDTAALTGGSVLLTAHDLHESPWGRGQQLNGLIDEGYVGDGVLIPEYVSEHLPIAGRGLAIWKVILRRTGGPVHEVMRPADQPSVLAAGAALIARLGRYDAEIATRSDPVAGAESCFIGQFHGGEIYNQYPQECWLEGTRRWLPGVDRGTVEREFRAVLEGSACESGVVAELDWVHTRDAFRLGLDDPLVGIFQDAYAGLTGRVLPTGAKPFVDDGNCFWGRRGIAAITHGPRGGGAHTVDEWVVIDELVRVAKVYALTAAGYCPPEPNGTLA